MAANASAVVPFDTGDARRETGFVVDERTDAIWLVKSSDRIHGPFTEGELIRKLRNREFMVIDEVITPFTRWRTIRDEMLFAGVVEEIRRGQMSLREDTEVQGFTVTRTLTETETEAQNDQTMTVTPPIAQPSNPEGLARGAGKSRPSETFSRRVDSMPIDISKVQDAVFVDHDDEEDTAVNHQAPTDNVRQYGVGVSDPKPKPVFMMFAWLVAIAVLAGAGFMLLKSDDPTAQPVQDLFKGYQQTVAQADFAWRVGDFAESLRLYRQANSLRPLQPEVVARMAPLLMQMEMQNAHAKRDLLDVRTRAAGSAEIWVRSEIELGLGLAALMSGDYSEASARFSSALQLAPANSAGHFNSGVAWYLQGRLDDAEKSFARSGNSPPAIAMHARTLIESGKIRNPQIAKKSRALLLEMIENHRDFQQEAYLIGAYLSLEIGDKKEALKWLRDAFNADPEQTEAHWHDPFLYLEPLSWKSLVPICQKVNEGLKTPFASAFLGLCLFKAGERSLASETIRNAITQMPIGSAQQIIQSVQAYVMYSSGRDADARAALKLALQSHPDHSLARMTAARLCERSGDVACAEREWREILRLQPNHLAALVRLSGLAQARGDEASARSQMSQARALSPTYLPVLVYELSRPEAPDRANGGGS